MSSQIDDFDKDFLSLHAVDDSMLETQSRRAVPPPFTPKPLIMETFDQP